MALTIKKLSPAKTIMTGGQSCYCEQHGIIQFNGTDMTGELPVQLSQIEAIELCPLLSYTETTTAVRRPTINATTAYSLVLPDVAGDVSAIRVTSSAGAAAHDTNYWTIGVINASNSNAVIADGTEAANSTKATGGRALVAGVALALALTETAADLAVDAEDTLTVTFTKAASAPALGVLTIEVDITDEDDAVTTTSYVVNDAISDTTAHTFVLPPVAGQVVEVILTSDTSVEASDTNYWTFTLAKGTTQILGTNTTKATGGAAIVAGTPLSLTLSSTAADLAVATGDTLVFTATKTLAAATLENVSLLIKVRADDQVTLAEPVSDGIVNVPRDTGTVTLNRYSANPAKNLLCSVVLKGV
jgi:hypothetical protein